MATVTGYSAERVQEIEDSSIVDGEIVGDNLILTRFDGGQINAGNVRGPQGTTGSQGPPGPVPDADEVGFTPAGNLAATNVQAALEELDTEKLSATAPKLKAYSEEEVANNVSGAIVVNYALANVHSLTLTDNVTDVAVTNAPASGDAGSITLILKQDATGGRTIAFGSEFKWPGGVAPVLSTGANAIDMVTAVTTDGGTTWLAMLVKGFS